MSQVVSKRLTVDNAGPDIAYRWFAGKDISDVPGWLADIDAGLVNPITETPPPSSSSANRRATKATIPSRS